MADAVPDLTLHEVPRRAARMFGELASTFVKRGECYVARIKNPDELRDAREPYRQEIVFGRGKTWLAAFLEAERHHREGTPDWILQSIEDARNGQGIVQGATA